MKIQKGFVLLDTDQGGSVLFPEGHPCCGGRLELNATGVLLWRELAQGTDEYGLQALLRNTFDVEQPEAAEVVERFLCQLDEVRCIVL